MTEPKNEPPLEPGTVPSWALAVDAKTVDRYLLGPELGRGGMGRVHAAWDPVLKRVVALKLLFGADPDLHLRLLREARTQAKLDHPGICRIHDLGHAGGHPYIAMQLVQGRSLTDLRPELDMRARASVMADVAAAIHAAHHAGLIHRDLKPANILVEQRRDGTLHPCVVDFGLARDLTLLDQTLSWAVMGTPAFMSPEQTQGEALGPATDIYSLGATLYALLSGHPPYEGSTLAGLITNQSDSGVRAVRRLNPAVPRDLETITLKCLEREPTKRYATAKALEEDLRRFLANEPILARPVGALGKAWRWAQRRPALAATAATGILVALLLLGWNEHIRATSRLREQAIQRFALEIRDAEHLLRIERMMPRHDIRPAEARLRVRLQAIETEMAHMGPAAQGPGYYALARGHLALRQWEDAIEDMEAAWRAGFHAPEVAYGLGITRLSHFAEIMATARLKGQDTVDTAKLQRELVDPALQWMEKAVGASIEHPDFGAAMVAGARGQYEEADRLFAQTLEQAPWFYEAWLGRFDNELSWHWGMALSTPTRDFLGTPGLEQRLEAYLQAAGRLAPSDETILSRQARLSWNPIKIGQSPRDDLHYQQASSLLQQAQTINPDSLRLRLEGPNLAIYASLRMLSRAQDPAPLLQEQVLHLSRFAERKDWPLESEWLMARSVLHDLCWVRAEADHRFGRDPGEALTQARHWRTGMVPHIRQVLPLLVEAQFMLEHGRNPETIFHEVTDLVGGLNAIQSNQQVASIQCESGRALLEVGAWQYTTGRPFMGMLHAAQGHLDQAMALDPLYADTYRPLPHFHALMARIALAQGQNPSPSVQAALAAGQKGVRLFARSTTIRAACADAHLADAEVRAARGEDPTPCLEATRMILEPADRLNPRDYRLALLRAEVELQASAWARRQGHDASAALAATARACRKGLGLKGDEPRFKAILAQIKTSGTKEPGSP